MPSTPAIETRLLPSSLAATHRGFAFYVAFPKSSIPDRDAFYVADPLSSIHHFEQIKNFAHLLGLWQSFWKRGSLRNGSQSGLV